MWPTARVGGVLVSCGWSIRLRGCHTWSACQASARTRMSVAILFSVHVEELVTHPPCALEPIERLRRKLTCTPEGGVQDENMLTCIVLSSLSFFECSQNHGSAWSRCHWRLLLESALISARKKAHDHHNTASDDFFRRDGDWWPII